MRNLLGRLLARSPRSIAEIARHWDIELKGRDVHQDVAHLFRVMVNPWNFAFYWDSLSSDQQSLVRAFLGQQQPYSPPDIASSVGRQEEQVTAQLRDLFRQGLLYADRQEPSVDEEAVARLLVPRELAALRYRLDREQELPDPGNESVERLLDRLDDNELADIAEHEGYDVVPAVAIRNELEAYLAPRVSDPGRIARDVRTLDGAAADLWRFLNDHHGSATAADVRAGLDISQSTLREAVRTLFLRGLIWRGCDEHDQTLIVVPAVIRRPEKPEAEPPPELSAVDEETVTEPDPVFPYAACWDLLTVLRATEGARTRTAANLLHEPSGHGNAAALRRIAPDLWRRDGDMPATGYLTFLGFLAGELGLIHGHDPVTVSDSVREWSRLSFADQLRRMMTAWLDSSEWPEGNERQYLQIWGADWSAFRRTLIEHLRQLDEGHWYTLESISSRFGGMHADALGRQFSAATGREHREERADGGRSEIVGLAAEVTIQTGCEWLGLIETARVRGQGLLCRLTPVGSWILGSRPDPPLETDNVDEPIRVNDDLTIDVLAPTPRIIWTLSAFTDLDDLGNPPTYRLTERALQRGLDYGVRLEQIVGVLERFGDDEVPETVAEQMQAWSDRYHRARLGWAVVIDLDYPDNLDELEPALREADVTMERVHSNRILVWLPDIERRDVEAARLEQILREFGHTPRWRDLT